MNVRLDHRQLRAARVAAAITQPLAALHVGVDVRSIRNWEQGVHPPGAEVVANLASLYGVSIDSLFVHSEEQTTQPEPAGRAAA